VILEENTSGSVWVFTDAECADFAYLCACMPTDRMTIPEADLIRKVEAKFRIGKGGYLTPKQWNWFAALAERYSEFVLEQTHAAAAIRAAARGTF
jgi:hypothetical protein